MTTALTSPAGIPVSAPEVSAPEAPRRRRDRDAGAGISAAELLARYAEAGFDTPAPGGRRAAHSAGPAAEHIVPGPGTAVHVTGDHATDDGVTGDHVTAAGTGTAGHPADTLVTRDVPAGTGGVGLIRGGSADTGSFGRNPRAVAATMSATVVGATVVMGVVTTLGDPLPQDSRQGVDLAGAAQQNTMRMTLPAAGAQNGAGGTSAAGTSLDRGLESVTASVPQAFEQADAARIAAVAQQAAEKKAAEDRAKAAENAGDNAGEGAGGAAAGLLPGSSAGAKALSIAQTVLGAPYQWGATGPDEFDCSGLMVWAFEQAGVDLPRTSKAQSQTDGQPVSKDALKPGDMVFFYSPVSHVGIYAGNGKVLHASTSGEPVKYSDLDAMPFHNAIRV